MSFLFVCLFVCAVSLRVQGTDVLIGGLTASDYVVTVGDRPCTQLFAFQDVS